MGNYQSTKSEVKNFIIARTPLIIIDTSERERVERMLREISSESSIDISYYTDAKQAINLRNPGPSFNIDSDPLLYIGNVFKKKRGFTFAFGDVKRINNDNSFSRELLNILYLARENNCTLILITADHVWPRLAQFGMLTTLTYLEVDERIEHIQKFIDTYKNRFPIDWDSNDITKAATMLRGFTEIQVENILSTTLITYNGLFKADIFELTKQKSRLYATVPTIQVVNISPTLEVSGLDALKKWLSQKKKIFFATDEELSMRDLDPPKGILLLGVPGCGKSFSAKMIAKSWELPLFRFDIGTIYDKWVGESEKKMKEALQFIDNVAPCILWIDEIEKALSVSDSGNDTGKRVLGQFLFWLQESKSRVFLVATANDVSLLPVELFRKGRFSEVFFIDLPNPDERAMAIHLYIKRTLRMQLDENEMNRLVSLSNGFSYADLEYSIKDVGQWMLINGLEQVDFGLLENKFKEILPFSQSNPDKVKEMQTWGNKRAVSASIAKGDSENE